MTKTTPQTEKRIFRILACLETLIDMVMGPGWNNDYENYEQRQADIERLRELIDKERILLYVPSVLVTAIHTVIQTRYGIGHASRVVQQILRISYRSSDIDMERILERTASTLLDSEGDLDFHEAVLIPYASSLGADAIVTRHPHILGGLCGNEGEPLRCDVPILKLTSLFGFLVQQDRLHKEDSILVMTPGGSVIRLPEGATTLDIAYKIHSDFGDYFERAFVNDVEVPVETMLRSGNVVRIEKGNRSAPDLTWLNIVKTQTAKKGIRRGWKRSQLKKGWELIQQEFGNEVRTYYHKLEYVACTLEQHINQLVVKVGAGNIDVKELQSMMAEYAIPASQDVIVEDEKVLLEGRPCKLASCCDPFPDDSIIGVLGKNDGTLWIHRANCKTLEQVGLTQQYPISWNGNNCWVQISILLSDKADTLRPLLNRLVDEYRLNPDLRSVSINQFGRCWVVVKLNVKSRQHLNDVVTQINTAPAVRRIKVNKIPSVSWSDGCLSKGQMISVFLEE